MCLRLVGNVCNKAFSVSNRRRRCGIVSVYLLLTNYRRPPIVLGLSQQIRPNNSNEKLSAKLTDANDTRPKLACAPDDPMDGLAGPPMNDWRAL